MSLAATGTTDDLLWWGGAAGIAAIGVGAQIVLSARDERPRRRGDHR